MSRRGTRYDWKRTMDGALSLCGDYAIVLAYAGTQHPFLVRYRGVAVQRAHGNYTGYLRFGSLEAAERAVERRRRERTLP